MGKTRGRPKTQEYTFEVLWFIVIVMEHITINSLEVIELQVRCSVKLFPALN